MVDALTLLQGFYQYHFVDNADEDGLSDSSAADQCEDLYVLLGKLGMVVA